MQHTVLHKSKIDLYNGERKSLRVCHDIVNSLAYILSTCNVISLVLHGQFSTLVSICFCYFTDIEITF